MPGKRKKEKRKKLTVSLGRPSAVRTDVCQIARKEKEEEEKTKKKGNGKLPKLKVARLLRTHTAHILHACLRDVCFTAKKFLFHSPPPKRPLDGGKGECHPLYFHRQLFSGLSLSPLLHFLLSSFLHTDGISCLTRW